MIYTIIIAVTILYLLKLLIDYTHLKYGAVSITTIKGLLVGFDIEEQTVIYTQENEEKQMLHTTIEIALIFVSILFSWQEDLELNNNNTSYE